MDQNNPNSGYGNINSGSTGTTGGTRSGGFGTGSSGGYSGTNAGAGASGFGVTSGSDLGTAGGTGTGTGVCPHCGQSLRGGGLEQFLGRLGITDDMINNLKTQFSNVDIDEYLNTARDYLKDSGGKAQAYAKDNPGKVAAGVAALALGAGLLYAAVNRDKA